MYLHDQPTVIRPPITFGALDTKGKSGRSNARLRRLTSVCSRRQARNSVQSMELYRFGMAVQCLERPQLKRNALGNAKPLCLGLVRQ